MIKKIIKNPLLWIFLLALILRIYKLGEFPVGFHIDEVKVGWNALSILKTGQDDWGKSLALYYNSFGDFRPTGIFYVTIPSLLIFGRNEFSVRFPSALFGALTIFPLYFFIKEILKEKKFAIGNWKLKIGYLASLLLVISPWHISVSRATSEAIISLFFALWALYFLIKGLNTKLRKFFISSVLLFLISYLFYHSVRLIAPIFVGTILIYYWKEIINHKLFKISLITFFSVSLITLFLMFNKNARGRFSQVSIFNDLDVQYELSRMPFEEGQNKVFIARLFHNKPLVYARRFVNEYTKYFSSNFYLESTTPKPARYQTVGVGLLTYVEFALLVGGLIVIAQKKRPILPLLLLLLAPIPAALTTEDAPNLHRALFMIPFLVIIESYGFLFLSLFFKNKKLFNWVIFTLLIINFTFFLHMYYVHNKVHLPLYRNVGAKEMALKINSIQKDYDQIIFTNIPDDPYPWIAFLTGREPAVFNKDALTREKGNWKTENLVFSSLRCPSRDAFKNPEVKRLLVVDAEGCATESNLTKRSDITLEKIYRPDGSEVYNLWSMK